ncbi:branched-chain amino acid transaminase [Fulvivirgaceae bacterium BMA10]|uniref:Branched-chain-amino-acid aminotransferase n=1 Tax=Splendidivirga corallicola TaxID=3051826 RepID=A0ABT8KTE8_9BACT|nr:branched-chain amino acid transaminase [Fulvivirgaceae bacterium BMA10]
MYYDDETLIYLDGNWVKAAEAKADLFCQTLHYGLGAFEGIRSYATPEGPHIFKAHEHFERLILSSKKIHVNLALSSHEFTEICYELLSRNNLTNAYIRPLVYMGANMALTPSNTHHIMIAAWEWGKYLGSQPLDVEISSYQRPNPKAFPMEAKIVGHYSNSILASTEAKAKGYDEALLLDGQGFVAEGPGANFFYEKNEVLYTPPLGNILPGITRATIMEYAREMGYRVVEKLFTPEDLTDIDSAFFTGTATEVTGIRSIDGKAVKLDWEDSIGYSLFLMYRQRVINKEIQDFTLV